MPSLIPISGGPISSLFGASAAPSPPVPVITVPISANAIKYRYREPYVSDATNTKFLGVPRGVYVGFTPSISGGVLTLAPDTTYGVSLLRVTSQTSTTSVDIYTNEPVTLDFNSHLVFPVFVIGRVNSNLGGPTTAEIMTSVTLPTSPEEVQICTVVDPTTVLFDAPANREEPYAFASADLGYGFMRDGAVEELINAVAIVTEVQNARLDLAGVTHPSLNSRLTADGDVAAVADRLANATRAVQSLDYVLAAPSLSIPVSDSFSAIYRTTAPLENINGFGSEIVPGAITSGLLPTTAPTGSASDGVRNVCVVTLTSTGQRLMEGDNPVYGRLDLSDLLLSGTTVFTIGSPSVEGVGTAFLSQVLPGDIICDSVGNCYTVATVNANFGVGAITLSTPSLASDTVVSADRHRFTLSFLKSDGAGGETPVTVAAATSLRFFFTVWRSVQTALFDRMTALHQNGEPLPVPVATTTTAGRALLAVPGTLAGALNEIRQGVAPGVAVGDGNFHTLNFEGCSNAGSGVLNVTQRGPTGPAGPDAPGGPTGPLGPDGPRGPGFGNWNFWISGSYNHNTLGPVGTTYYWNLPAVGYDIKFLTAGVYDQNADGFGNGIYSPDITFLQKTASQTARLTAKILGNTTGIIRYFMITAGE